MENQPSLFDLYIDEDQKQSFTEMAKWAKFLGIMGFIMGSLSILIGIVYVVTGGLSANLAGNKSLGLITGIIMIVFGTIYMYPSSLSLAYGNTMPAALRNGDQLSVNAAVKKLRYLFRFMGVMTLVVVSLYVLVIVAVVIAATLKS